MKPTPSHADAEWVRKRMLALVKQGVPVVDALVDACAERARASGSQLVLLLDAQQRKAMMDELLLLWKKEGTRETVLDKVHKKLEKL